MNVVVHARSSVPCDQLINYECVFNSYTLAENLRDEILEGALINVSDTVECLVVVEDQILSKLLPI
jgi:hypothetical protein